jgi:hypothetical protein
MKPMVRRCAPWAAQVSIPAVSTIAEAHSPIQGLGTFYNYFLHPFVVPPHAILLIAVALMLGQQGRDRARSGLVALGLAFISGDVAARALALGGAPQTMLLCGAVAVGGAVILDRPLPTGLTTIAAAVAGFAIGVDSGTDGLGLREELMAFAGVSSGAIYLTLVIAGLTVGFTQHWRRVGVRIAGSWIVAAAALVLALSIAGPLKRTSGHQALVSEQASKC